jgi:signal transduction histidine kinase
MVEMLLATINPQLLATPLRLFSVILTVLIASSLKKNSFSPYQQWPITPKLYYIGIIGWGVFNFFDILVFLIAPNSFRGVASISRIGYTWDYPSIALANVCRDIAIFGAIMQSWLYYLAGFSLKNGGEATIHRRLKNVKFIAFIFFITIAIVLTDTVYIFIEDGVFYVDIESTFFLGIPLLLIPILLHNYTACQLIRHFRTLNRVEDPQYYAQIKAYAGGLAILGVSYIYWIIIQMLFQNVWGFDLFYFLLSSAVLHGLWALSLIYMYLGLRLQTQTDYNCLFQTLPIALVEFQFTDQGLPKPPTSLHSDAVHHNTRFSPKYPRMAIKANQAALQLFEADSESHCQMILDGYFHQNPAHPLQSYLQNILLGKQNPTRSEWAFLSSKGAPKHVILQKSLVLPNERFWNRVVISFFDITDRVVAEEQQLRRLEMEQEIRMLEQTMQNQERFLTRISHELRTPLNGIIGFSQLLKDELGGKIPQPNEDMLTILEKSGEQLLKLVEQILDVPKGPSCEVPISVEPVDLHLIITSLLPYFQTLLHSKEIHFLYEPHTGPLIIGAESKKIQQVLYCLLDNAIKFSESDGEIRIATHRREGIIELVIQDKGVGMDESEISGLFHPFGRLSDNTIKYPGPGMGLYYSKKIVETYKGKITVNSDYGAGTSVFIQFPPWTQNHIGSQ